MDSMDKAVLHDQIDALGLAMWRSRALLHAMVDAGAISTLECQLPDCKMPHRGFLPREGQTGSRAMSIVVDHILPRACGGGDRLDNLRILHDACNVRRDRKEGWNRKVRVDDRRGGNKRAYLNKTQVEEIRARYAAGEYYRQIAPDYGVTNVTIMHAVRGILAYEGV